MTKADRQFLLWFEGREILLRVERCSTPPLEIRESKNLLLVPTGRKETKMTKYKLNELKTMVRLGIAEDISDMKDLNKTHSDYECLGLSFGKCGMNGGLFYRLSDNTFCAITKRNANLLILA